MKHSYHKKHLLGRGAESGKGLKRLGGSGAAGDGVDLARLRTGTGRWELLHQNFR